MNTRNKFALLPILPLLVIFLLSAGEAVQAQATGSFYFAVPGSTTPITTYTAPAVGQSFTLAVYFSINQNGTTFDPNEIDVLLGFDQTTTEGAGATPQDNLLTLNGTPSTAVSNINSSFPLNPTNPNSTLGGLGGGQPSTSGAERPYGDDLNFSTGGGAETPVPTTPTLLFDISLENENLTSGSEAVTIYNGGTGTDYTTYLTPDGSNFVRPSTDTLTVSAAPEPAQSATIGLAALGLGVLLLRAHKRRKAETRQSA